MNNIYQAKERNLRMNSFLARIGFALVTALTSTALFAADLEAIDVGALPGESVELKLQFDRPVAVAGLYH